MTPSDLTEFIRLVREMRAAQRDYFRDRGPQRLERSKKLERDVDAALVRLSQRSERGLFDESEEAK